MDAKDEIKQRLSVEEVIGEYLELKPSGRNLKALSPFGNEKTPSFMVSPEKQIWHDFSTNKGGDIFTFVMEVEGVDFVGALEILARRANVDLSQFKGSRGRDSGKVKDRLLKAHDLAAQFYHAALSKNNQALEYIKTARGFTPETIREFRLGFSPNQSTALVDFLQKRGFSGQELVKAGLATDKWGGLKDLFRGRIMVPLADGQGNVIGFTGRILIDNPKSPKYLNTPATMLYDKSRNVFGLHLARSAIRESDSAVIVEGNMDVIGSHQAGVKQVVATAGTAITIHHLQVLKRLTSKISLCFDADVAGQAATERAISLAQTANVNLYIVNLPEGFKDPDELASKKPEAWKSAIEHADYIIDWLINYYQKSIDIKQATGKREFTDKLLKILKQLQDPVEQSHYLQKVAKLLDVSELALQRKLDGGTKKAQPKKTIQQLSGSQKLNVNKPVFEDDILAICLAFSETREVIENIPEIVFSNDSSKKLIEFLQNNKQLDADKSTKGLPIDENYAKILLFKAEQLYNDLQANERLEIAYDLKRRLLAHARKIQQQKLTSRIQTAEQSGDDKLAQSLLKEYQQLLQSS